MGKVRPVPKHIQDLARRVRDIKADFDDFDGDRRGHAAALIQAEENLVAACLDERPRNMDDE